MKSALMQSFIRMRAMLFKEFLQLLRDPRMRFFVVVPPIIQLVIFGYAANFDVKNASVAVVDQAHSSLSRRLLSEINSTGHFTLHYLDNMQQADEAITKSTVRAILHFPVDFEKTRAIAMIADGSDSNSALLVVGQLSQSIQSSMLMQMEHGLPITIQERAWFNPNLDDREYFVPGIIANVVLLATMILTAMAVVREREMGTLERLLVTPLARLEFVLGKVVPVACVGLFDVALVTIVAILWFKVPFRGDVIALFLGTILYLMSSLGLGLLISSFSSTQQQALMLAFFLLMPLIILSGFAFPIRNMPESVQLLTYLDPIRYYLVIIRDAFLKGGNIMSHSFEFGMMGLLGLGALSLSVWRIR